MSQMEQDSIFVQDLLAYTQAFGITMRAKNDKNNFIHAPCTTIPSIIDGEAFEFVNSLAADLNFLVDRVAEDEKFLTENLKSAVASDEFIFNLFKIFQGVQQLKKKNEKKLPNEKNQNEINNQLFNFIPLTTPPSLRENYRLGIHRSDYMFHREEKTNKDIPLQVEINTISSSFGCLSSLVSKMHRDLCGRYEKFNSFNFPPNPAKENIVNALAKAHWCYISDFGKCDGFSSSNKKNYVILMIVQEGETNITDQKLIEYGLWQNHQIPLIRMTFKQVNSYCSLSNEDSELLIDSKFSGENLLATIVYFRAGYTPRDFPSESSGDNNNNNISSSSNWKAYALLEFSNAIKCPNISYHLAGTKKIQQVLSGKGVVEEYLSASESARVRKVFADLYGLEDDSESVRSIINEAIANPNKFVLKPQREGGGNNVWGDELAESLKKFSVKERGSYILMSRIMSVPHYSSWLRNGTLYKGECVSELGIYSTFLSKGNQVIISNSAGHLLRTKPQGVDEGGVAAGFAALDSPILLNRKDS